MPDTIMELENDLCELLYTAHVLTHLIEAEFGPKGTVEANATAFLAYNVEDRVAALKAKYLVAREDAKSAFRSVRQAA